MEVWLCLQREKDLGRKPTYAYLQRFQIFWSGLLAAVILCTAVIFYVQTSPIEKKEGMEAFEF